MRAAVAVAILMAGCVDLSKEEAARRYFVLAPRPPLERPEPRRGTVLEVRSFRVSRAFEGREFVYRRADGTYESDFYNCFFIPPATLVGEAALGWLRAAGIFEHVVGRSSLLDATHVLEASISELSGDFTRAGSPRAAMEIHVLLLKEVEAEAPRVLLSKTYRRSSVLRETTPAALVAGWNEALSLILRAFEEDLDKEELELR